MVRFLAVLALAAASLAAGCFDFDEPTRRLLVPEDADSEIGTGSYRLVVRVTEEHAGGAPLAGAAVAVFRGEDGEGGRTDASGEAVAHLTPGKVVTLAASRRGYTTEEFEVFVGGANETGAVTIPLFRRSATVAFESSIGPGGSTDKVVGGGPGHAEWALGETLFGAAEGQAGYLQRVRSLRVEVAWNNTMTAYADLAAAANAQDARPTWFSDARTESPGQSDLVEVLELDEEQLEALREHGRNDPGATLFTGAMTRLGALGAPDGEVPFRVGVEVTFASESSTVLE